jgi:hypothetical protein
MQLERCLLLLSYIAGGAALLIAFMRLTKVIEWKIGTSVAVVLALASLAGVLFRTALSMD